MSLRTSVYLEATEAVVRSQALIGSLANPDVPETQAMATYQQDLAALGKIQVVGTEETVRAVATFSNAFTVAILDLSLRRGGLTLLQHKIKEQTELVEGAAKNRDDFRGQWYDAMLKKKDGPPDYYKQNLDNWTENHQEWSKELEALQRQEIVVRFELMQAAFELAMSLGALMNPAVIAVRKELELPLDEKEFMKMANGSGVLQRTAMQEFMNRYKALTDAAINGEVPAPDAHLPLPPPAPPGRLTL